VQAFDRQHERLVALKLRRVGSDDVRERLLAEGRALLGLRPHPALPVVRDDFFIDDRYVLVMDWVDGTSAAQIVRERGDPGMAVATVLGAVPVIADALDHLHQHKPRVIHGDVPPRTSSSRATAAPRWCSASAPSGRRPSARTQRGD